jgi:hypothetical protein
MGILEANFQLNQLIRAYRGLSVADLKLSLLLQVVIKQVDHDLGYIDLEEKTLQPLNNPFGPRA